MINRISSKSLHIDARGRNPEDIRLVFREPQFVCCCVCKGSFEETTHQVTLIFADEYILIDDIYYLVHPPAASKNNRCKELFALTPELYISESEEKDGTLLS